MPCQHADLYTSCREHGFTKSNYSHMAKLKAVKEEKALKWKNLEKYLAKKRCQEPLVFCINETMQILPKLPQWERVVRNIDSVIQMMCKGAQPNYGSWIKPTASIIMLGWDVACVTFVMPIFLVLFNYRLEWLRTPKLWIHFGLLVFPGGWDPALSYVA